MEMQRRRGLCARITSRGVSPFHFFRKGRGLLGGSVTTLEACFMLLAKADGLPQFFVGRAERFFSSYGSYVWVGCVDGVRRL